MTTTGDINCCCLCPLTEKQLLLDDIADIANQWMAFEIIGAEYKPFRERMKAEKEVYFIPSMRTGKAMSKLI